MAEGKDEGFHIILTKPAEMHASALARRAMAEGGQTYKAKPLPGHQRQQEESLKASRSINYHMLTIYAGKDIFSKQ